MAPFPWVRSVLSVSPPPGPPKVKAGLIALIYCGIGAYWWKDVRHIQGSGCLDSLSGYQLARKRRQQPFAPPPASTGRKGVRLPKKVTPVFHF